MALNLVNNVEEANFITHSGSFHADETFCTALFELLFNDVLLFRTRNVGQVKEGTVVYDVGKGELDHHQPGGNGTRENGIKYAAFGLVWLKYGKALLEKLQITNLSEVWRDFDQSLICGLDSYDNGQIESSNYLQPLSLNKAIEEMNPKLDFQQSEEDEQFLKAVKISSYILVSQIKALEAKYIAQNTMREAIANAQNQILVLPKRVPWEEWLLTSQDPLAKEILFIIRPGKTATDGFSINAVPSSLGSMENRLKFPREWGGKTAAELQDLTGIASINFCHPNGFLCVTDTYNDAYNLALLAIKIGYYNQLTGSSGFNK